MRSRSWIWLVAATALVAGCGGPAAPSAQSGPPPGAAATGALAIASAPHSPSPSPGATSTARLSPVPPIAAALPSETEAPPTATEFPVAAVVEAYIAARAVADVEGATLLSCAAWQAQAATEAISFRSMNAEIVEMACHAEVAAGDSARISCTGKIVTHYGGESRDWSLAGRVYTVVQEGGEWKMCGYQ